MYIYLYVLLVIRTIGEIIGMCGGRMRILTHMDILCTYMTLAEITASRQRRIINFLSEFSLLHTPTALFAPPIMAGAIFFLAALVEENFHYWPPVLGKASMIYVYFLN